MDGIMLIAVVALLNSPFYALVVHNAVTTRVNRELLERLNGQMCDGEDPEEDEDE